MRNSNRQRVSGPALALLPGLFALVSGNAWAVAGAGPPDTGAAMEGLFYMAVGLMVFAALLVIWIARKLVLTWRNRRNKGHDDSG